MAHATLINGNPIDEISIYDRGLQYGDGLFETIAVQDGEFLCWQDHIERLIKGCERLNIPRPDQTLLKSEASSLINSTKRCITKIIITRGRGGRGYALPESCNSTRIISVYPWPDYPDENSITGINTRICSYRYSRNPALAGIKHLNRLEQILARSEWSDTSVSEGFVMDQDENIIEGTMSNLFYVTNNTLCTPDLTHSGVAGVIRKKIIKLASELDIETSIKNTSLELLNNANEIFICNSLIGIWPVKTIAEKGFTVGEKTKQLKQILQERHFIPC